MNEPLKNLTRKDLEPVWNARQISLAKIAAALGVSRQGLTSKAKTLGLKPRGKNYLPQQRGDNELFTRMWTAGVHVSDMTEFFGYSSPGAVTVRRRNLSLPARTRGGGKGHGSGWVETISIDEFWEIDAVRRLHEIAAKNRAEAQKKITKERAEG